MTAVDGAVGHPAVLSDPDDLCRLLGFRLSDEQLAAVEADLCPAVVVAGAGSGKTTLMAARVAWLVGSGRVAPEHVLGLTFTNKAAAELSARVQQVLGRLPGAGEDDVAAPAPVVSTYHAFAQQLVREHGLRAGLEPGSRLLADATRYRLAAQVLRAHRGRVEQLTQGLTTLTGYLVDLADQCAEHLVEPDDLRRRAAADEALLAEVPAKQQVALWKDACAAVAERQEWAAVLEEYAQAKTDREVQDFGDLVRRGVRLATDADVRAQVRDSHRVVLLDEYQDTSVAQRVLLSRLFGDGHPVTAVGDPCQAIYGWRGAAVSNLDRFGEHYAPAGPVGEHGLTVNRRSGGRLLVLANALSADLRAHHPGVAELRSPPGSEDDGRAELAQHERWADECAWVARRLREEVDAGTPPHGCAVLVRTWAVVGDLVAALRDEGLPVEAVGLGGLLGLPEVADVVATLRLLADPADNAALLRLLTGPRWRLGPRDLVELGRRARHLERDGEDGGVQVSADPAATDHDRRLEEAVGGQDPTDVLSLAEAVESPGAGLSADGTERVRLLRDELRGLRRHVGEPLVDLVMRVVRMTALDVEVLLRPGATERRRGGEDLSTFVDVVADYVGVDGEAGLTSFLAYLEAAQEHERGLDASSPSGADAVAVMTVHKAKGLEFDVVAVPNLVQKVFPQQNRPTDPVGNGRVLPWHLRGDRDDQPHLASFSSADRKAYGDERTEHHRREERRLAYVAVTRARRLLLASAHWWGPTQKELREPSPYLTEMRALVEADEALGQVVVDAPRPEEAENPHLPTEGVPWPPTDDDAASSARREQAARVARVIDERGLVVPGDYAWEPPPLPDGLREQERDLLESLDRDAGLLVAEAEAGRAAEVLVPLPRRLSTTSEMLRRRDPAELAQRLARPLPARPAPAARRGTRFHAWVEEFYDRRAPLLDTDELPGAADEGDDADVEALKQAFLDSEWADRTPEAVEVPFAVPGDDVDPALAGRVLEGRIDAVFREPDDPDGSPRWLVVDWKTGRGTPDATQLALYRHAWARLRGVPEEHVAARFVVLDPGDVAGGSGPRRGESVGR